MSLDSRDKAEHFMRQVLGLDGILDALQCTVKKVRFR